MNRVAARTTRMVLICIDFYLLPEARVRTQHGRQIRIGFSDDFCEKRGSPPLAGDNEGVDKRRRLRRLSFGLSAQWTITAVSHLMGLLLMEFFASANFSSRTQHIPTGVSGQAFFHVFPRAFIYRRYARASGDAATCDWWEYFAPTHLAVSELFFFANGWETRLAARVQGSGHKSMGGTARRFWAWAGRRGRASERC